MMNRFRLHKNACFCFAARNFSLLLTAAACAREKKPKSSEKEIKLLSPASVLKGERERVRERDSWPASARSHEKYPELALFKFSLLFTSAGGREREREIKGSGQRNSVNFNLSRSRLPSLG
jgi:hypothetical protein